jgi:chromosome segregation ATPase
MKHKDKPNTASGEAKSHLEQIQELKREIGMLEFDMETLRVQRSNYKHLLQESRKETECVRAELAQATSFIHLQGDTMKKLKNLCAFFGSALKSGEGWTGKCQSEKQDVLEALIALEKEERKLNPSA